MMRETKISFRCPGCEEVIGFPGTEAGTVQECPGCGGWVDVPELTRSPNQEDPWTRDYERQRVENERQTVENARLLEESRKSHEEWQRQLKQSALYQDRAEESFRKFAALIARWESLTSQLEATLNAAKSKAS